MKYLDFRDSLKMFTVFSLNEIRKVDEHFHRRRLNEWQEKGYIKKVIKGYYVFSDLEINENVLFEIANKIHSPSYISYEMALSYYHLIPESVYAVTSVSSRRPYKFKTQIAEFIYRRIKPDLFWGYELLSNNGKFFKMACLEKAILDYFYNNSHLVSNSDFESLRINASLFWEQIDEEKIYSFLEKFAQKRLTKRINSFMVFMKNA